MIFRRAISFLRNLYLKRLFFAAMGAIVGGFMLSFGFSILYPFVQTALAVLIIAVVADLALLYLVPLKITGSRHMSNILSLGDENTIRLQLTYKGLQPLSVEVIDELPAQLQMRNLALHFDLKANESIETSYTVRPVVRGAYQFGKLNVFVSSGMGLVQRRIQLPLDEEVAVYPSVMQMKQFELMAFARISHYEGIKQTRRIGHSYEFEQIKYYVPGDDYRSINWKATSRRNELMVNQYEDERAQQVYCIIDKSRNMLMPFNELSLLDYAINTTLVVSNISLLKHDKAGMLTFSDKLGTIVKADRKRNQLKAIMEALYRQKERPFEANYEMLYLAVRNMIKGRSLLFLFTNFESTYAVERTLPILRKLNRLHLLVVVFFENTEMSDYLQTPVKDVRDIYHHTIAESFVNEKRQVIQELARYGIQAILTRPEELSLNAVNKYLELKARGLI